MSGELQVSKISVAQGRGRWKWLERPEFRTGFIRLLLALIILHCHICTCVARVRVTLPLSSAFLFPYKIFLKAFSKGITRSIARLGHPGDKEQGSCSRQWGQGPAGVSWGGAHLQGAQHPAKHLNPVSVLWERVLSQCSRAGAQEGHQCKLLLLSSAV